MFYYYAFNLCSRDITKFSGSLSSLEIFENFTIKKMKIANQITTFHRESRRSTFNFRCRRALSVLATLLSDWHFFKKKERAHSADCRRSLLRTVVRAFKLKQIAQNYCLSAFASRRAGSSPEKCQRLLVWAPLHTRRKCQILAPSFFREFINEASCFSLSYGDLCGATTRTMVPIVTRART